MWINDEFIKEKLFYKEYQDLIKKGIDFSNVNFKDNNEYKKIEGEIIYLGYNVKTTLGNIIYKYYISNEVKKALNGPYALGYTGKEPDDCYTIDAMCKYIDLNFGYSDTNLYFERNKTGKNSDEKNGLIRRLNNWGINLDEFNDNISKCKLLYYLYHIENNTDKNIRLFKMLNKPTLENVDNSRSGEKTRNGEFMFQFKSSLFLEISVEVMLRYNYILINILLRLDKIINYALMALTTPSNFDTTLENRISQLPDIDKLFDNLSEKFQKPDLFIYLYLKLIQHENLGRENDILDLLPQDLAIEKMFGNQHFECMSKDKKIEIKKAKKHLKENRKEIAKLVFNKEKVSSNDYKKYDNAVNNIENIIKILMMNTILLYSNVVSEKLLIVALQCYIYLNKNIRIENFFYRYKTSDKKFLHSEMNAGDYAFKKNQLAIVKLIYDTYYNKCGKQQLRNVLYKFETYVDNLIKALMSSNSIEQMLYMYSEIIWFLQGVLYTTSQVNESLKIINNLINGYKITNNSPIINRFIAMVNTSDIILNLAHAINMHLEKCEYSFIEEIKIIDDKLHTICTYECEFEVCFISKHITVKSLNLKRVES